MAAFVRCPKCSTVWRIAKCGNCSTEDTFFKKYIHLAQDREGDPGVFCARCDFGVTGFECSCGCKIHGGLFQGKKPFFTKPVDLI